MGILANSASHTMTSSDPTDAEAGYLLSEQIVLSTNPTGASYSWSLARPAASNSAELTSETTASTRFIPDVAGTYVAVCVVAGTTFVLVIDVAQESFSTAVEAIRLPPRADSQITAPSIGYALYNSSTQGTLAVKNSAGAVFTIELTAV